MNSKIYEKKGENQAKNVVEIKNEDIGNDFGQ